jgi:hypothetical protein
VTAGVPPRGDDPLVLDRAAAAHAPFEAWATAVPGEGRN